ncbi:unnamed protein product [Linum tenue]|uniref:Uncharacterized protein n=1 Tax=Linum tenue TaxID=586396 RepID=A0AAV0PAW4_9ROSI|nr:unnamed protein product [Linum tenue]
MASISLFSVGKTILEKLGPLVQQEAMLLWNLRAELEKLVGTVSAIQALLLDAEEQQEHSHQVKDWLEKLQVLLLDAEDLLDDVATEALREEAAASRDRDGSSWCKIQCWTPVCFLFSIPNRLIYSLKMAHKVKSVREQLDAIHADNTKLQLSPRFEETGKLMKHTITISSLPNIVVGREDEVKHIKQLLLLGNNHSPKISVVSIVGIGGMGKTALAQLIYNDRQVKEHFKLRLWACVSELFEVNVIIQKILESATGGEGRQGSQLNALANRLEGYISEKRFFLVLDDVWNFDSEKWDVLRSVLNSGANGSKILVTTRFENFAKMMSRGSPDPPYALSGLSSPQSWSLFRQVMSGGGNYQLAVEEPLNITSVEEIKEQIMKKSAGVPLAVKTVANLLCLKDPQTEWLPFLRSNELLDAKHNTSLLHNLKLSYQYLPSHLKRCFLFCSLYPKGYRIPVPVLIFQWVALGLIESSEDSRLGLYDLGVQYVMDLTWRSFFQELKIGWSSGISSCRMHDLIHDLAVSLSGSTYTEIDDSTARISKTTYHMSLSHDLWSPAELAVHLGKAKQLQTFFTLFKNWYQSGTNWDDSAFRSFISRFPSLRVLHFKYTGMETLPHHIQGLKHLRYLNISSNDNIVRLPDSITMLQNLQVLHLDYCKSLQELPRDINKLVNLWILKCTGCFALTHMPVGLGELTRLERVSFFVVGQDRLASRPTGGLDELYKLDKLRIHLRIANLGVLRSTIATSWPPSLAFEIGAVANLKGKIHLQTLFLRWDLGTNEWNESPWEEGLRGSEEDAEWDESLLEGLQPHPVLKSFQVAHCRGGRFPSWISSLTNLVTLSLYWCKVRHGLHHLQGLPILRRLIMVGLIELEYMDEDEDGDSCRLLTEEAIQNKKACKPFFPSLKKLKLRQCPKLKGWRRRELLLFPELSKLFIEHCPLLTLMPVFPKLTKKLKLIGGSLEPLLCTMNWLSSLGHISSSSFSSEVGSMQYPLSKLKKLVIFCIDDPPREWLQGMQHLTSLQEIKINECSGLEETLEWHNLSHVPNITIDKHNINRDGQFLWDIYGWDNFHQILKDIHELVAKGKAQVENSS